MTKYDDASWHYGGDFPPDLPHEAGATHIGMFLAWVIHRDLASDTLKQDFPEAIERVRLRQMTGRAFLLSCCDEKLTDDDLNDQANRFAASYLDEQYINDYVEIVPDAYESVYHLEDTWENFDLVAKFVDHRFEEWSRSG